MKNRLRHRAVTRSACAGWVAVISHLSGPLLAQDLDLSWIAHERLKTGQILAEFGDDRRFRGHIRAAVLIDAPAERIWEILEDCESAPEFVPNVLSCELRETLKEQNSQVFRQRVKVAWFLPAFEHEFRLDYKPYSRIDVNRVSGPLAVLDGAWWLVPGAGQSTILTYFLNFDSGLPIPRFVVGRILQRDIPVVLAAVRDRAEEPKSSAP